MTTYNTGNPIGSKDPRDLYDNAENLDTAVNDTSRDTWSDRLGRSRKTMSSMEREFNADQYRRESEFDTAQDGRQAQFAQLMISGGYEFLGDYAASIELTAHKQVVREAGEFWRPAADTVLPYTTTGAGMPEGGAFVNIGDGLLRQDLVPPVATFNNVADMKGAGGLDVGRKARTLGYYTPGDGGGCDYEIVAAGTGSNYGFLFEQLSASGLEAKLLGGGVMEDKTVYIPTDYATLQEAVNDLKKISVSRNSKIILLIESGHVLESSFTNALTLSDGNYSHFWIRSVDSVVPANLTGRFLYGSNCVMPVLDCLVDMQGIGSDGYYIRNNVNYYISSGAGVINAGIQGFSAKHNCHGSAHGTKWSGAGRDGIWVEQACTGDFEAAEAIGVGRWAIFANHGTSLCARLFKGSGAGENGAYSRHKSLITLYDADLTGSGVSDLRVEFGGQLEAGGAIYSTTNLTNQSSRFINQINVYGLIHDTTKLGNEDSGGWTPVIEGETTSGSNSYSVQSGRFRRQGRLVWIYGRVQLSSKDPAMAGGVFIRGLPFAPSSFVNSGCDIARVRNINVPPGFLGFGNGRLNTNGIQILISQNNGAFPMAGLEASYITDTTEIYFSAVYEIDLSELQALGLQ